MIESSLARWVRYGVYACALIPLVIFNQYLSPFHFGKVVIFRSIVEVMLAGYLILMWRERSYRPQGHPITWAFFAFAMVFTVTTITSVNPLNSLQGTLERMGGLFTFWHYFTFYLIAVSVLKIRGHWRTLIDLMIAVGVVSALYGFLQKLDISFIIGADGRARPFGTIGNPALFAGYQLVLFFLTATLLQVRSWWQEGASPRMAEHGGKLIGWGSLVTLILALFWGKFGIWVIPLGIVCYGAYLLMAGSSSRGGVRFYQGATLLFLIAVASTAVRGSMLGIVFGILVFLLFRMSFGGSARFRKFFIWAITGIALFVFFGFLLRDTPLVQNSGYLKRITDFSANSFTIKTRIWAWEAGIKGWLDSPRYTLVGWGPENFNIPFSVHFNPQFFQGPGSETFFDRAHNMFVEVLVTMGALGLVAYLALFGALLRTLWRWLARDDDSRILGSGFIALIIAYMVHNAFIFDTSANFIVFFSVAAFIVFMARQGQDNSAAPLMSVRSGGLTSFKKLVAGVLVVGASVGVYIMNIRPVIASYTTSQAIITGLTGDIEAAAEKFEESIGYGTAGRYEFRHRFAQYLLEVAGNSDIRQIPPFEGLALQAIAHTEDNVRESSRDYLPLLYIAKLYIALGKYDSASPYNDQALEYTDRALEISPTFIRTYYEIGQAYLNKQEYDKAFSEAFKPAADLNPSVGLSSWYAAVTRLQSSKERGDIAGIRDGLAYALQAAESGYTMSTAEAQQTVAFFLEVGDVEGIARFYEALAYPDSKNIFFWEQLAASYIRLNQLDDVVRVLRDALQVPGVGDNPDFRAKALGTLQQLGVTL